MSPQERASVVGVITNLSLNAAVILRLWYLFDRGALTGEDAASVWARTIVWTLPAAIALTIGLSCAFAVAARERFRFSLADERDRKFQFRGMAITLVGMGIGYMAMLVGLAIGWPTVVCLTILYAAIALGDLLGNVVRLASYRIGT